MASQDQRARSRNEMVSAGGRGVIRVRTAFAARSVSGSASSARSARRSLTGRAGPGARADPGIRSRRAAG
jgi:hypothetical protein